MPPDTRASFWDKALNFGRDVLAKAATNYTRKYEGELTQLLKAIRNPNQAGTQGLNPGITSEPNYDLNNPYAGQGSPDQSSYGQGYEAQGYDPNQGGYDQQGYDPNQGGYDQQGYDPNQGGYNQQGYNDPNQGGYDQQGYDPNQGGYNQQGYDPNQGGYDQQGYNDPNQGGYDQQGYDPNQGGYNQQGYNDPNQGGYNQQGYDPNQGGYNQQGYNDPNQGGYNQQGYNDPNQGGYDQQGYNDPNQGGYNQQGYNDPNQGGYDQQGYDPNQGGYNQQGYNDPNQGGSGQPNLENSGIQLDVALVKKRIVNGAVTLTPIKDGDILKDGRGDIRRGDKFRIMFRANCDCYVYVIAIDGSAWAQGVFPTLTNPFGNPVTKGKQYVIPDDKNWLSLDQYKGIETIFFVASPQKRQDIEKIVASIAGKERNPKAKPVAVSQAPIIPAGYHGSQLSGSPFVLGNQTEPTTNLMPTTYFSQTAGESLRITRWFRHE